MANFVGSSDSLLLFTEGSWGVVVDSEVNVVVASGASNVLVTSRKWTASDELNEEAAELAELNLSALVASAQGASSKYTIPKSVQTEAKKAIEWRKEEKRGGTDVGMNTARTLAKGGQIGLEKVRHIAKYFPRHEVDKQGKGWKVSEDGFPSNGRIAWALWGGDAAWRWASAIVEREDKKALTADGYGLTEYPAAGPELESFEYEQDAAPEFICRVNLDGSGMDRLYKTDIDGQTYLWDDGRWDDLGLIAPNIWEYDAMLDGTDSYRDVSHIAIDPESAIVIAARLYMDPHTPVRIEDINEHEAELAARAIEEIDWELIDQVLTAAADPAAPATDGVYTPDERSENASQQVRNASGQFAKAGSRVVVGGDTTNGRGEIVGMNGDTQMITVALDNGRTVDVAGNLVDDEPAATATPATDATEATPIDVSGILGEPRTPINRATAQLPGTLPAMTSKDLGDMLANWPAWVKSQRDSFSPLDNPAKVGVKSANSKDTGEAGAKLKQVTGKDVELDAYNHPLLNKWLNQKDTSGYTPNKLWYNPLTAAGAKPEGLVSPKTSDVKPIYMAIVDPDDARAVLALVSLVPASSMSNAPMTYVRKQGEWVRDPKTLTDLNSATPPSVIPLDSENLDDVLKQVDETQGVTASLALTVLFGDALTAAGGLDRNRGNAEKLRRYWTKGEGAAKIRWGQGGDWKRCVRLLSKHMGVRAKGYCQLRHKEALGYYTATHAKMDRAKNNSIATPGEDDDLSMIEFTEVTREDMQMPLDSIVADVDDFEDGWEPDAEIIVILSDPEALDEEEFALIAAGGLDRNRGKAEQLRKYWTVGKGGAKIRWGTGGDWTRCVRQLTKYMGARSKGYCALRHKEMNGMWPGDQRNQEASIIASAAGFKTSDQIIEASELRAKVLEIKAAAGLIASADVEGSYTGAAFSIPLVIPEDLESGDGRKFKKGAIELRELPLPLLWQLKTGGGHDGSVVVGRIDHMERTEDGIGNAYGVFDTGTYGREAERLVREGFLRGVSADMDRFEAQEEAVEEAASDDDDKSIKKDKIVINKARVMAVTIVPKPAFQECKITLVDNEEGSQEDPMVTDGVYIEDVDPNEAEAIVASGMIANAIPTAPPVVWFENPKLNQPTPLTVTDDGKVFGHIAAWHIDHIGMPNGTKPPRSRSNYAYFHTGVCRTEEGSDIPVGQLTLAGGHASITADAAAAVKHYDDTASAIADVHAGEDAYGIWVAGALRPGTTPEQIRTLRASAPSGDWRPVRGSLELVAVCQVNVPGFPIARAMVAGGQVTALVAAGAHAMAKLRSNPIAELSARLAQLEAPQREALIAAAEAAKAKFAELRPIQADAYGFVDNESPAEGIYEEVESHLVKNLEQLLADIVAFSFRVQGYHWNVKGSDFAQYHALFGGIYADVHGSIDPMAESILKQGYDAPFNITTFATMSPLGTSNLETADCCSMAYDLYEANQYLVSSLKNAFAVADAANEQGVADFIAGRIDAHQTWAWQLKASSVPTGLGTLENESTEEPYQMVFSALQEQGLLELQGLTASAADDRIERIEEFAAMLELASFTEEQRKELAKKGQALKDGSYPIRNEADLKNAIRAIGRANKGNRAAVKRHILKRAKALGATKLIPASWSAMTASVEELQERIANFSAELEN
jgi:DNA-binding ferritin-like protein